MTDIIAHYLTDKQTRYKDTHYRIYQVNPVDSHRVEVLCKELLYIFNKEFQNISCQCGKDSHQQTQY